MAGKYMGVGVEIGTTVTVSRGKIGTGRANQFTDLKIKSFR